MYPLKGFSQPMRLLKKVEAKYSSNKEHFNLDKVLLLNKLSRLDIERLTHPNLNDNDLAKNVKSRGIDFEALVENHKINENFQKRVQMCFENFGVNVRKVNRFNCSDVDIEWCDALIPVGGDGTFLNAARHILNRDKPVIGFNSHPSRSEGFLCLPKKYSSDVSSAVKKLKEGNFRWMFRTRIRVTFSGTCSSYIPTDIHDVNTCKFPSIIGEEKSKPFPKSNEVKQKLPVLALNEVFMSEIFAARVSYFEMCLNKSSKSVQIKSSGLCVCTGTGSTSWNLSINRISKQDIRNILELYNKEKNKKVEKDFDKLVQNVSDNFNQRFRFNPEERILNYTIRDLISLSVWPQPKGLIEPRGFAHTIEVKSKCLDAAVIIDGGLSFPFNEGTISHLEIHPEDSLRTVVLYEE